MTRSGLGVRVCLCACVCSETGAACVTTHVLWCRPWGRVRYTHAPRWACGYREALNIFLNLPCRRRRLRPRPELPAISPTD